MGTVKMHLKRRQRVNNAFLVPKGIFNERSTGFCKYSAVDIQLIHRPETERIRRLVPDWQPARQIVELLLCPAGLLW